MQKIHVIGLWLCLLGAVVGAGIGQLARKPIESVRVADSKPAHAELWKPVGSQGDCPIENKTAKVEIVQVVESRYMVGEISINPDSKAFTSCGDVVMVDKSRVVLKNGGMAIVAGAFSLWSVDQDRKEQE